MQISAPFGFAPFALTRLALGVFAASSIDDAGGEESAVGACSTLAAYSNPGVMTARVQGDWLRRHLANSRFAFAIDRGGDCTMDGQSRSEPLHVMPG